MENTVTKEMVDKIFSEAKKKVYVPFDKCTVVCVKLKNGIILTESLICTDAIVHVHELAEEICFEKIKNKIWELEWYKLQCENLRRNKECKKKEST